MEVCWQLLLMITLASKMCMVIYMFLGSATVILLFRPVTFLWVLQQNNYYGKFENCSQGKYLKHTQMFFRWVEKMTFACKKGIKE